MPSELYGADKFIHGLLAASVGLAALVGDRIYSEVAPQGAAFPHVVFSFQSGLDRNAIGAFRIFTRPTYLVKAVTKDFSLATANQIAAIADDVLMGARGTIPSEQVSVMGCHRLMPVRYTEVRDGVRYNHVGGQYRLFVCKET